MLKKMRWQFVRVAMAAFAAVILILLLAINLWNYRSTVMRLDQTIAGLQELEEEETAPPFAAVGQAFPNFSPEFQYTIRFFTVSYDREGRLASVNQNFIASVSREEAVSYADTVRKRRSTAGIYQGYRYRCQVTESGTRITFLNAEQELEAMRSLLMITVIIAGCSLLAVFLLAFIFSKRAVAPFVHNVNAQKSFITNASHELKTPLTAIATSAGVLQMEQPENEWVQNIQRQTTQLADLINNMVTLTKLDEEHPDSAMSEFSVTDTAWEVVEPFSSRARACGKELVPEIVDDIRMTGHQEALQQLLSVLLDNALKYSDPGSRIRLRLAGMGKKIEIQVENVCADAGKLDTSRLFERFYRGDTSHNNSVPGNGIGLSIAKAAAEANKGSISVQTTGDRIRFTVVL